MRWASFLATLIVACRAPSSNAAPEPQPALRFEEIVEAPAIEGPDFIRIDPRAETAYASIPVGARDRRPIVVGVHGAGDRADWACAEWKAVVADWAFVVCPQGHAHPQYAGTFQWGSARAIGGQAERAVDEIKRRYGPWVADGPLVYAGWSWGATLAADVVAAFPGRFDRVILVEAGHTPLDANQVAATFARGSIRRTVVSCSSAPCRGFASRYEAAARRQHVPVALVDVGNRGHWFDEPVFRALAPKVAWMVDDEPRFVGLGAAIDARWMTD
jgi:pimeloyl-ACP methyl ester carboxylesterase